jgi:2-methylisocitrate lyase-like PEP mutase family enzyme
MINMFRGGRTPAMPLEQLGALGFGLVIIPSDLQRATIQAMQSVLTAIRTDGDSTAVDNLLAPLPARDEAVEQDDWLDFAARHGG